MTKEIEVIVPVTNTKGRISTLTKVISSVDLKQRFTEFCETMIESMPNIGEGDISLTEMIVTVEFSAEGGIQLIGTSKVSASSAIQLKFERAKK